MRWLPASSRRFGRAAARFALGAALLAAGGGRLRAADAAAAAAATPGPVAAWPVEEATVTISLPPPMLRLLGLRVDGLATTARRAPHRLSIVPAGAPSFATRTEGLAAEVDAYLLRGFAPGGALRLRGGFRLRHAGGVVDLRDALVRPGSEPYSLELVDARGEAVLATAGAQWDVDLDTGALDFMNADLRLLPAFARRLGDEAIAGTTLGTLDLEVRLRPGRRPAGLVTGAAATPPPCGDWSGEVDVALIDIDRVEQRGLPATGRVVVVPSVKLKNVGTANVPWFPKYSGRFPPYDADQHPFLVWQLLRWHDGRLVPLGRSQMKHAFRTGNENCTPGACNNPNILGLGCEDPYDIGSNTNRNALGPRNELNASTGTWPHAFCGEVPPAAPHPTHFDVDGNGCPEHTHPEGDFHAHGMRIAEADLGVPGARYFMESFYVVRDDVDVFNTMGFLEVTPTFSTATNVWTFPIATPYAQGPAIDLWAPAATAAADVDNRVLDTGVGHLQVAARVTELGGGVRQVAYAVQNHDFDRRVASFHVPFDATGVTATGFADGDENGGNAWTSVAGPGGVTWTAPAGNELDWGSLFAFHFDTTQPVGPGLVTLTPFEPGGPASLPLRSLVPGGVAPALDFHTVTPCRLLDTRAGGGPPIPSGRLRTVAVPAAGCGVPATATAVAVNVTATQATGVGHLAVYSADLPDPPATSTLGFSPGITRANNAVAALSPQGGLGLRPVVGGGGGVHVIVDVVGYFAPAP